MKNRNNRVDELIGLLSEGGLSKEASAELAELIRDDASVAEELREQLETSEMIALCETPE